MEFIVGKDHRGKRDISVEDIIYVESYGDDIFVRVYGNSYKVQMKLHEFETTYSHLGLLRINKSYVINVTKIRNVLPYLNYRLKLKMINDEVVYVNRTYMKTFKKYIKEGVI
ncbi:LytTR family DNA-binding domain-containing protein [Mycoplasmatota bacterium WC44]